MTDREHEKYLEERAAEAHHEEQQEEESIQQLIDAREGAEEDLAELRKHVKALLDALDKGALIGDGSSENNGEADELGELAIAALRKEMERENETD